MSVDFMKWTRKGNVAKGFVAWRRVAVCVLGVVLVLSMTGCSRQRAELAIKKAKNNIQQARDWNADKFDESKSSLQAAETALKSAEQALAGQQFSEALSTAQQAVKQSQASIDSARTRYADQVLQEARKSVEVAKINDGDKENPELYKKAEASLQVANDKYQKQKYDDSIKASRDTIMAVDQLLAHLKNTAINKLDELKGKLKELELVEAEKYQPQAIVRTRENIDNITKKIEQDRDYKQAIVLCGSAITDAENGIIETKKTKSQAELRYLESKIAEARADEAIIYTPDRLQQAERSVHDRAEPMLHLADQPALVPDVEDGPDQQHHEQRDRERLEDRADGGLAFPQPLVDACPVGHRLDLRHQPGDLARGLALRAQRDEEAGQLHRGGVALHHPGHRPGRVRRAEVLAAQQGGDSVGVRGVGLVDDDQLGHPGGVDLEVLAPIELHHAVTDHALAEVLVGRADVHAVDAVVRGELDGRIDQR